MFNNNPKLFTVGENGFAPPLSGGSIGVIGGTVEYTDTTAKNLGEIPENAVPVLLMVSVVTDFNDSTGDTLDIGITGDGTYFATALDVATAGNFLPNDTGMSAGVYGVKLGEGLQLTVQYTEATGNASQGLANILLFYYLAGDTVVLD